MCDLYDRLAKRAEDEKKNLAPQEWRSQFEAGEIDIPQEEIDALRAKNRQLAEEMKANEGGA